MPGVYNSNSSSNSADSARCLEVVELSKDEGVDQEFHQYGLYFN